MINANNPAATNANLCGCATPTTRTFAPGHDARLRGHAVRAAKGIAPLP